MPMKNILILCTGNSCRSQIAHGYFAHFGKQNLKVYSAGIETHGVNPKAIATMADDGIDISGIRQITSMSIFTFRLITF